MYVKVRHRITGKLLFEYCPERQEIRMYRRGEVIDTLLTEYGAPTCGTVVISSCSIDNCAAVR